MIARALARARQPLYRNAFILMGNSAVTAGLGFVFWTLTARLYPPAEVGLASAAISAALFVTTVSQLGLPYALVRFAPSAGVGRQAFTSTVVLIVTVACAVAGAVFTLGLGTWAPEIIDLAPEPLLAIAIITLAAATGASTVLVYTAVSARDARPAFVGGMTHGFVKSALVLTLAVLFARVGFLVVLAWLIGTVAAVLVQLWLLRGQVVRRIDLSVLRLEAFLPYTAGNWASDLAWAGPGLLFPLIVVGLLGAEANAFFFVPWAIASLLVGIPTAVASSLLAEGSHAESETRDHLRRAISLTVPLVMVAIVAIWVGTQLVLGLFGAPYAANGADTLRLLTLAGLPLSINMLFLTVARVDHALRRIVGIAAATGGGSLVLGAALAPSMGAVGIAFGYLVAHTVVAVVLGAEWLVRGATSTRRSPPAGDQGVDDRTR